MVQFIQSCYEKCILDQVLTKEEILKLLSIPVGSEEDLLLRRTARKAAAEITENRGCIWGAVGMDFAYCPMNCRFCSFGEAFGLIKDEHHVSEEELLGNIRAFVEGGASYVTLRTTEFYSLDRLIDYVRLIRERIPGKYEILLNTGELDPVTANRISGAGVYGVYHALRLREGEDTPFDPEVRRRTMRSAGNSDLHLMSFVEPLGPRHSDEEIADRILNAVSCRASMCGIMKHFPVKGTPLGDMEMIDDEKAAHVTAVIRLSVGRSVRDICAYPASKETFDAGANIMIVECGAIPRDLNYSPEVWTGLNMEKARKMLADAGYRLSMPPAKKTGNTVPCCTPAEEEFMRPVILKLLTGSDRKLYDVCEQVVKIMHYQGLGLQEAEAIEHAVTDMERCGHIRIENDTLSVTEEGIRSFYSWKRIIDELAGPVGLVHSFLK